MSSWSHTLRRRLWISHSGAKLWDTPVNNRGVPLFCVHYWSFWTLLRDRAAPFLWVGEKGRFHWWVYRTTSDTDVSLCTTFSELTRIKFGTENCRWDEVNPDIRPLPERDCGVIISSKSFPLMPQNTGGIRGSQRCWRYDRSGEWSATAAVSWRPLNVLPDGRQLHSRRSLTHKDPVQYNELS